MGNTVVVLMSTAGILYLLFNDMDLFLGIYVYDLFMNS